MSLACSMELSLALKAALGGLFLRAENTVRITFLAGLPEVPRCRAEAEQLPVNHFFPACQRNRGIAQRQTKPSSQAKPHPFPRCYALATGSVLRASGCCRSGQKCGAGGLASSWYGSHCDSSKGLCAWQIAASAASPQCPAKQKTICQIMHASPAARPALSEALQMKLREARASVEHCMAPAQCGLHNLAKRQRGCVGSLSTLNNDEHLPCGLKHCRFDMEAGNTAALHLFTSVGFVVAGCMRRYYCSGKGAYIYCIFLGLPFLGDPTCADNDLCLE